MSQSQEIEVPELVVDEDTVVDMTSPPSKDATSEVTTNQAPSTPATAASAASSTATVPAKPQKPKKRAYTKRGGASASETKVHEDSDEDEVCGFLDCVNFIYAVVMGDAYFAECA